MSEDLRTQKEHFKLGTHVNNFHTTNKDSFKTSQPVSANIKSQLQAIKKTSVVYGFDKVGYARKNEVSYPNSKPKAAGQIPMDLEVTKRLLPGKTGVKEFDSKNQMTDYVEKLKGAKINHLNGPKVLDG